VHKLLNEGTKPGAILVLFDAMDSFSGHVIDRAEAVPFQIGTRRHHFALRAAQRPAAQDARQEVQVDFILKVEQDFAVFRLFLVLF